MTMKISITKNSKIFRSNVEKSFESIERIVEFGLT